MADLAVRELPLFPLPEVVLFPQEVLPLHIFESRYRMMLKTVLDTDSRFGVIRFTTNDKEIAEVGCCAQIIRTQTSEDGRSNIVTVGQQRFRVLEITRKAPFCSALVSWIDDEPVDIYGFKVHSTYIDFWPLLDATEDVWEQLAESKGVLVNEQLARIMNLKPNDKIEIFVSK